MASLGPLSRYRFGNEFWTKPQNQREYMDQLGKELGFKTMEDWFKVTVKDITDKGGSLLLTRFNRSPLELLKAIYPEFEWSLYKFSMIPKNHWNKKENQKHYMDWLGKHLGFKTLNDWYNLKAKLIIENGGSELLRKYQNSLLELLKGIYPDHSWVIYKFQTVSKEYWVKRENQIHFMCWMAEQFQIKNLEDWYKITATDISRNGGYGLLSIYQFSLYELFRGIFPQHKWSLYQMAPKGYFDTKERQREFMDWLAIVLGIKNMDDWYKLTTQDLLQNGGTTIYVKYGGSPSEILLAVYPEYPWCLWKFQSLPRESTTVENAVQMAQFLDWFGKRLGIRNLHDWYRVSSKDIAELGSPVLFKNYPLEQMLRERYPDHKWEVSKLSQKGICKASQRKLAVILERMFPDSEVMEEWYHKEMERNTNRSVQLDVFLLKENLAFEYQGAQHYLDIHALGSNWYQQQRDEEKRIVCKENNITLVEIPYWWDFEASSLLATIHEHRPDLVPTFGDLVSIPKNPIKKLASDIIGLMHGEGWSGKQDLTGWWMSEKMDGVRAYWNGQELLSRKSRKIESPPWFTEDLPKEIGLDGELWMGRMAFDRTLAVVNSRGKVDSAWKQLNYVVFDLPHSNLPYEFRMEELKSLKFPAHVKKIEVKLCKGNSHLLDSLNGITANNGEGLVLIKPQSFYLAGRQNTLLKVKIHEESEVQLMEIIPTGLYCQQINGYECIVGCSPNLFKNPPPIGSVLTVKHDGFFQTGTLRNAFYWRVRSDISWGHISEHQKKLVFVYSLPVTFQTQNANWTDPKNCRVFFDDLKQILGYESMDDFVHLSPNTVREFGGKAYLDKMSNGSITQALQIAYHEHKWYPWKFPGNLPFGFWEEERNQREFMDWLGKQLGFDCMDDWYRLTIKDLMSNGASGLVYSPKYRGSPPLLLQSVYPEHKWIIWRFETTPKGYWDKKENQRAFMDFLAQNLGFKEMDDWYKIKPEDIIKKRGATLLKKYSNSPFDLLESVYPEHSWSFNKAIVN